MFTKILETFFRHRLLVLAPIVLIPGIVVPIAWATAPMYVEAVASVWAGTPPVPGGSQTESTRYLTPAQVQINRLSAMLRTRWMRDAIAGRTAAAALVGTQAGEDKLQTMAEKDLTITASGDELILLRFRGPSAQLSQQFLQAVIDTYKEKTASDRASAGEVATSFYQRQLQDAQAALNKANAELRRYLAAHPDYTASTSAIETRLVPLSVADSTLAGLQNNVQYSQKAVEDAKAAVQQAQLNASAAMEADDAGLQVIDAPTPAAKAVRDMKTLIVFPVAAIIVGLGFAATLLVVLVASDRTARTETDLCAFEIRVLGTVPHMQIGRGESLSKNLRGGWTTRRAISFVAGAALPAPAVGGD